MKSIELVANGNTAKVFVDGKEIDGVQAVLIEKHGMEPIKVEIKATVKEVRVGV